MCGDTESHALAALLPITRYLAVVQSPPVSIKPEKAKKLAGVREVCHFCCLTRHQTSDRCQSNHVIGSRPVRLATDLASQRFFTAR